MLGMTNVEEAKAQAYKDILVELDNQWMNGELSHAAWLEARAALRVFYDEADSVRFLERIGPFIEYGVDEVRAMRN